MSETGAVFTYAYKHVGELAIHLDIYPPQNSSELDTRLLPAVIYFHGGALTVGNRTSWFPSWLHRRVVNLGMVFVSADYRLIPPSTGHDILEDIKDLFSFLAHDVNRRIAEDWAARACAGHPVQIDPHSLAVSGSSAGVLCAYLAAAHASPRPKAVLSLYGMGGDMLTSHYLIPKTVPFFRGREILEPNDFSHYLYPAYRDLPAISDSPLAYHPLTYHIPGYPANARMLLGRLYLQMGIFLDYYTGCHDPSLSASLRTILRERAQAGHGSMVVEDPGSQIAFDEFRETIPSAHRHLFPQFSMSSALPPMLLVHGSADTAVLVQESENLQSLLRDAGVLAELVVVEGKEHSFDYELDAESEFGGPDGLFDRAVSFLAENLRRHA
ncbi:alpha/beta-hydrolase [Trametes cingulata]|nr:alpha/beta-hydrolase [Trametes cingulata]